MATSDTWQTELCRRLASRLSHHTHWSQLLRETREHEARRLHLAIFVEPYLQYVLEGKKTVESRFSKRPIPPYGTVSRGDLLALKRSSGPVVGVCEVRAVWRYELDSNLLRELRLKFERALCAMDEGFWQSRTDAKFLTLMQIGKVLTVDPVDIGKTDRRGWVTLQPPRLDILPFS
jgi:hypothetical protein